MASALNLTAERFRSFDKQQKISAINSLSESEAEALLYNWEFWRRDNQAMPEGTWWTTWLILAGRGYGKTRCGAEAVRYWIKKGYDYVNMIGPTADDVRDALINGESGLLAICSPDERPEYYPSKRCLVWPNGATSLLFSAEEPDRLRNKQHKKLWCDEVAAWKYPDAWDQAMFGLRLGDAPQVVATTTPRPTKLIKELASDPTTVLTRGTSYQNRENLAPAFYKKIITKYEGTRLGKQELQAEILSDNPNSLFKLTDIEANRVTKTPLNLQRVVVPIDPAATSNEDSDETGIVPVAIGAAPEGWIGKAIGPHFYVLADVSGIYTPNEWGKVAVAQYHQNKADKIVGEMNNGGEMVESTIRNVDVNVSYKGVHATRGKVRRAEPIGALYEQGRVHHVGVLSKLEDQMTDFNPATFNPDSDSSPDRMDSLVWGLTELSEGYLGDGLLDFFKSGVAQTTLQQMEVSMVQTIKNLAKPVIADEAPSCPKCSSKLIQTIGTDSRCGQCGNQWARQKIDVPSQTRSALLHKINGRVQ